MVRRLAAAEGEVDDAVDAQLAHVLQAPCAHVLAQLQRKVAGGVRLVLHDLRAQAKDWPGSRASLIHRLDVSGNKHGDRIKARGVRRSCAGLDEAGHGSA